MNDTQIKKLTALEIAEISKKILEGKYHIHEKAKVPIWSLKLWTKRGYNPNKIGLVHVHYPGIDKKYKFPLYFWVVS